MRCPKCGEENCSAIGETETQGFGAGKGICGYLLLGPFGLLCGLCGMGKTKGTKVFFVCNNCGRRFNG